MDYQNFVVIDYVAGKWRAVEYNRRAAQTNIFVE